MSAIEIFHPASKYFYPSLEVLVDVSLAEVVILQGLDRATDVGGSIRSDPMRSWVLSQRQLLCSSTSLARGRVENFPHKAADVNVVQVLCVISKHSFGR